MSNFNKATRPVASFIFHNTESASHRLCLFPGHFMTATTITEITGLSAPFTVKSLLSYADPTAIIAAGYSCDQVADDFSLSSNQKDSSGSTYKVKVTSKSPATRYRDFLNYIKSSGLKVVKMRITDLSTSANPSRDIFQQSIEVTQSAIGSKAGSDFVQLSSYINPANFLQNFIDVDLEKDARNLSLDETTLAFLDIPGNAHFQIDFTLAE